MRIRPILWLALLLTFGAPGASPVSAEDAAQTGTNREAVMRIFKSGNKFVVAVYRADGSAALGLLEPPKNAPQGKGKQAAAPTLADLKDWRVVTSVEVAPEGQIASDAFDVLAVADLEEAILDTVPVLGQLLVLWHAEVGHAQRGERGGAATAELARRPRC